MRLLPCVVGVVFGAGIGYGEHRHRKNRQTMMEQVEDWELETPLYNFYNLNPIDLSYNFSYDTGWSSKGRSFRFEERQSSGDVTGEFGWITRPGGGVRITKYTADRQGYRVKHITRDLAMETKKKEVLIIGPIPPFLKESHLAANPGAVISQQEGGEQRGQDQGGGGHVPEAERDLELSSNDPES